MSQLSGGTRGSRRVYGSAALFSAVLGVVPVAGAVEIIRANNTNTLNLTTSWDGGVVPGPDDVAVWGSTSGISGNLGADLSFGGVKILGPSAAVSINGGNVLTLGASGIDMSNATQDLTLQPGVTGAGGINLGATQTWNVGTGRLITAGSSSSYITGTSTLTKSGAGTLILNTASSTFSGGVTLNAGLLRFNANSVGAGGTITNGPLGTGTLTVNGGTLAGSAANGRDFANDVKMNADLTLGIAGTPGTSAGAGRLRFAGTFDLGGATRTINLANNAANITNGGEQFAFVALGGKNATVTNGTLRFAAPASATATNPSTVSVSVSGGALFSGNSGLTIGQNVLLFTVNGQGQTGANSPTLTLETGGVLLMTNGGAAGARSFVASSLSGNGIVATASTDPLVSTATLTIDGGSGVTTFGGVIQDGYSVFGTTYSAVGSNLAKSGSSTQILTGVNTYTGPTTISGGGTLQLGNGTAGNDGTIANTSGVTVSGGGTLAYNRAGSSTAAYVITGSGSVAKSGPGTQTLTGANTYTGTTVVSGGTLEVNLAAAAPLVAGTGTTGGTDIKAGSVSFIGGTATTIRGLLKSSYDDAATVGVMDSGTLRSSTATLTRGLGYRDTGTAVIVKAALFGDADLDGGVSINDFNTLAGNFGASSGKVWVDGDFDYDGGVSINDFNLLAGGFGQSIPASSEAWAGLLAFAAAHNDLAEFEAVTGVPEPTSLGLIAAGATLGLRRRRRRA